MGGLEIQSGKKNTEKERRKKRPYHIFEPRGGGGRPRLRLYEERPPRVMGGGEGSFLPTTAELDKRERFSSQQKKVNTHKGDLEPKQKKHYKKIKLKQKKETKRIKGTKTQEKHQPIKLPSSCPYSIPHPPPRESIFSSFTWEILIPFPPSLSYWFFLVSRSYPFLTSLLSFPSEGAISPCYLGAGQQSFILQ